jgi:hypothetical protein
MGDEMGGEMGHMTARYYIAMFGGGSYLAD